MTDYERYVEALACHGATFDGGSEGQRLEIAREWEDHFGPHYALAILYMDAGIWCPITADQLGEAGVLPEHVKQWPSMEDMTYGSPAYALCNGDTSLQVILQRMCSHNWAGGYCDLCGAVKQI